MLDGHSMVVRGAGPEQLVRLLGVTGPATPAFAKSACGELQGVFRLLRPVYTRPSDSNPDGYYGGQQGRFLYEQVWSWQGLGGSAELGYWPTGC